MIELVIILNERAVNFCAHFGIVGERASLVIGEAQPVAPVVYLLGSFETGFAFAAADEDAQLFFLATDTVFEGCGEDGGEAAGVPVKGEDGAQSLEPDRIAHTLDEFVGTVFDYQ